MNPAAILDTAVGLLSALANVAKLAGQDDAAAALEKATAMLADRRAEIAAIRAKTDAELERRRKAEAAPLPDIYRDLEDTKPE